jgi:aspartate/methionine/tyrosine aminotransferase
MQIRPFELERYFATYEFTVERLLSASDCESLSLAELLVEADDEARAMWESLSLGYTESQGHPVLRAEVADLYEAIRPEEVLVAAPEEAIFIAMNSLLQPGDHVIVVHPAYQSLYSLAEALGCRVTRWPLAQEGDGWHLDMAYLDDHLTRDTKLIVINFPHNPTGHIISHDEHDHIVAKAQACGAYIFSDEMYRMLEMDPAQRLPSLCDLYVRGITLSGLSKAYGLPGLRIGWLATHDAALMRQFVTWHDYTTICNSAPSEVLGIIALRAGHALLGRSLDLVRSNLRVATAYFGQREAFFRWLPPMGGSVAFPGWQVAGVSVSDFCRGALESQSLMIVPGGAFDFTGEHFRVGLGRADFAAALGKLEAYLADLASSSQAGQRSGSVSS